MFSGKPLVFTDLATELRRLPLLEAEGPDAACALRRELRADVNGTYARFLTQRLDDVAAEVRSKTSVWTERGATDAARTLWVAARHATTVITAAWTAIHGRSLSVNVNPSSGGASGPAVNLPSISSQPTVNYDGQAVFLLTLGQIGILAAWDENITAAEAIHDALRDLLPLQTSFLVPYALGLVKSNQLELALSVLKPLTDIDEPKASVVQGFIFLVSGDGRWKSVFTSVAQLSTDPDAKECAQYWIDFIDASTKDVGAPH